jgi:hypothetical protein
MPFRKLVSDPEAVQILNAALAEVCRVAGIKPDSPDVEGVISFLMPLYWRGNKTATALRAAIKEAVRKEEWDC